MKRWQGIGIRAGFAALCVWACLSSAAIVLLDALVPLQRAAFGALMPDFKLLSFGLERRGAHLKLRAVTQSTRYLVLRGKSYDPGIAFEVETPARVALLYAVLIVAGTVLTLPSTQRALTLAILISVPTICAMTIATLPVLLAGQQWGLTMRAGDEFSPRATLVAASGFLLHGGGFALCTACVWAVSAATRSGVRRGQ